MNDLKRKFAFVCCVEAGGLELQTVRMAESLRKWGGAYAECDIMAVRPRAGVPLTRETLRRFDELGVKYHSGRANREHAWFKFLNKPHALLAATEALEVEQLCWIDSDIILTGEPTELLLQPGEDLAACASDKNIGTTGSDEFAAYWTKLAEVFGLTLNDMTEVRALREDVLIKTYFNSGVFSFRRDSKFAEQFLDGCIRVLHSKVASSNSGIYFTDQVALGLVAIAHGHKFRELPLSHNFPINVRNMPKIASQGLGDCRVCHYHDCLWAPHHVEFGRVVGEAYPDIEEWLKSQGPLKNPTPTIWKAVNNALQKWRAKKVDRYTQTCQVY